MRSCEARTAMLTSQRYIAAPSHAGQPPARAKKKKMRPRHAPAAEAEQGCGSLEKVRREKRCRKHTLSHSHRQTHGRLRRSHLVIDNDSRLFRRTIAQVVQLGPLLALQRLLLPSHISIAHMGNTSKHARLPARSTHPDDADAAQQRRVERKLLLHRIAVNMVAQGK